MAEQKSLLERIRAGEPFLQPDEAEFWELLIPAKAKMDAYNAVTIEAGFEAMLDKLRELLGKVGAGTLVVPPVLVDIGVNVEIGENTFINANVTLLDTYPIRIGNEVMIGPNVSFYPVGHPLDPRQRLIRDPATGKKKSQLASGKPIVVEDEVWIGGSAVILQGVTIGRGSTVGAGSVVTKSIPPGVFAAGNPCRVIRKID
jgi:maltose O-acetyltransferase